MGCGVVATILDNQGNFCRTLFLDCVKQSRFFHGSLPEKMSVASGRIIFRANSVIIWQPNYCSVTIKMAASDDSDWQAYIKTVPGLKTNRLKW